MKGIFKTASNYRDLNGKELLITRIEGTSVECVHFADDLQKNIVIDFKITELVSVTVPYRATLRDLSETI